MESFYTILTNIGLAAIANAQVSQSQVDFVTFVVGDSNGSYYNPTTSQTSLVNEVWRGPISAISIDEKNANWVIVEAVIPATVGGFAVREIGVLDTTGQLLAVGKVPETYKPVTAEGSLKDLYLRMILEVSNASVVALKVDPTVIFASKKYVDDTVKINIEPLRNHIPDAVAHIRFGTATGTNIKIMSISPPPVTLADGLAVSFKNVTENTEAVTLKVNNLDAMPVVKANGNPVSPGQLKANGIYTVRYNATTENFILQGEGGEYGTAGASDVLSGTTIGTENGIVQGTLSLTGDALANNVLAGKTFYNTNAKLKITGTIPNYGRAALGESYTNPKSYRADGSGGLVIEPNTGYYEEGKNQLGFGSIFLSDTKFVPANIKADMSIFGVTGTAIEPVYTDFVNGTHSDSLLNLLGYSMNNYVSLSAREKLSKDGRYLYLWVTNQYGNWLSVKIDLTTFEKVWESSFSHLPDGEERFFETSYDANRNPRSITIVRDGELKEIKRITGSQMVSALSVDKEGNFYVLTSSTVTKYDQNLNVIYRVNLTNLKQIRIIGDRVFLVVIQSPDSFIQEIDPSTGSIISKYFM